MRLLRVIPLLALFFALPAFADGPHRLALQISDNDADKMNAVLNVAANVSKYYSDKGEEVDIPQPALDLPDDIDDDEDDEDEDEA